MAPTKKAPAKEKVARKSRASPALPAGIAKNKTPAKRVTNGKGKANAGKNPPISLTPANNTSSPDFVVRGKNEKALFTLTSYRGEGMCLLAMNWKEATPPEDFVGFAIEYMAPGAKAFRPIYNRIAFPDVDGKLNPNSLTSRLSPIQKFRWIHFPSNATILGFFTYRVTPVFMDVKGVLSYGDFQDTGIQLEAETYPGEMNICFTRGFVSSQAFVEKFGTKGGVGTILPKTTAASLDFKSEDPKEEEALTWMGFEARSAILRTLDAAIADPTAQVRVAAYDLNEPEIVDRLDKLGDRLQIIIDDSGSHKGAGASETRAAEMLTSAKVQRQHIGGLQHNKFITVDSKTLKIAIGGSTNFSWRGLYVQNNNAVVLQSEKAVEIFNEAFDNLWASPNKAAGFSDTASAEWIDLGFRDVDAQVTFSPHSKSNTKLEEIGNFISETQSSLFYSLAFLYETKGFVRDAITKIVAEKNTFVYGLSDKSVGGLEIQQPNGNPAVAYPAALMKKNLPPPFSEEATGGSGTRLHHKFIVIDFNTPNARVYTGSYNFSNAADGHNGENLFVIKDQRVATSYMVEAVSMFDHYSFRNSEAKATDSNPLVLKKPPTAGEEPWWDKYWTNTLRKRDRELFGQ